MRTLVLTFLTEQVVVLACLWMLAERLIVFIFFYCCRQKTTAVSKKKETWVWTQVWTSIFIACQVDCIIVLTSADPLYTEVCRFLPFPP